MQPCVYKPELSVSRMTLDHTGLTQTEIKYHDGSTVCAYRTAPIFGATIFN